MLYALLQQITGLLHIRPRGVHVILNDVNLLALLFHQLPHLHLYFQRLLHFALHLQQLLLLQLDHMFLEKGFLVDIL